MQAQIDEAIEKIKVVREIIECPHSKDVEPCNFCKRTRLLDEALAALAKLKEEPEQGEFTKNIRANLERWDLLPKEKDCRIRTIIAWLKEVCRRYDWLVKRNVELQAENKSEPTEFTKEWRKRFVESESFMAISGAKESQIMEEMRKACDIIEQLTDKYDRLDLYNCDMMQKYQKLQADKDKLVEGEGQQAKKEAGS